MRLFDDGAVNLDILRERAFNYRWAEVPDGVIPLTAADPDFPVAKEITDALISYIGGGYLPYTPKLGIPAFREAVSRHLRECKGEEVPADLVLPIDSAARGMYVIARTVLRPGDEAIVFDPVDYLFKTPSSRRARHPSSSRRGSWTAKSISACWKAISRRTPG